MLIFLGKSLPKTTVQSVASGVTKWVLTVMNINTVVQSVASGVTKWVLTVMNINTVFVHVTPRSWLHCEQAILEHRQQVPLKH